MIAGPKLYDFITKGGKVDTSKENGDQKVFSNFQLETKYTEVKKLDDKVKKLLIAKSVEEKKEKKSEETKKTQESKGPKKRGRPKKGKRD